MRVLAVRDDGAELIGEHELSCGLLQSDSGSAVMPVASAMARGNWGEPHGRFGEVALPDDVEKSVRDASEEFDKHDVM